MVMPYDADNEYIEVLRDRIEKLQAERDLWKEWVEVESPSAAEAIAKKVKEINNK